MPSIAQLASAGPGAAGDLLPISQGGGANAYAITPSDLAVLANGATTARTLAARLSDVVSIEDFGVVNDPNGQFIAANTAAYLAAIARVNGQARLRHRAGLSLILDSMAITTPLYLELDGTIKLAAAVNNPIFNLTGSNFVIKGAGTLDGNKAAQTSSGGGCAGINTGSSGASNVLIEDITIQNTYNWPVNLTGVNGCNLNRVKMIDGGNSPEFGAGSNNCWADQCVIKGISDDSFAFYQGCTNSGITRSDLSGGSAFGIIILTDGGSTQYSSNILVAFNTISGMAAGGLSCSVAGSTSPLHDRIKFLYNDLIGNCLVDSTPFDLDILNAIHAEASGNYIESAGQAGGTNAVYGVSVASSVSYFRGSGNRFNSKSVVSNINAVCYQLGGGTSVNISDTTIESVGNKYAFGFDGSFGPSSKVSGTTIIGSLLGPMNNATIQADTLLIGNDGINDLNNNVTARYGFVNNVANVNATCTSSAPADGQTMTIPEASETFVIVGSATLSSLTFAALPAPTNVANSSQSLRIQFNAGVTALTWTGTIAGAAMPSSAAAGAEILLTWQQEQAVWFHGIPA